MGNFVVSNDRIGSLFEHLVVQTIRSTAQALDKDIRMSVFRTAGGAEVDIILEEGGNLFALEVKATKKVAAHDFRGLSAFAKFIGKKVPSFVVSMDEQVQTFGDGMAIPLAKLWPELGWKAE
jgi:predicted AAA+ superfamily ATPase